MTIPQARIVSKGGQLFAPPPVPREPRTRPSVGVVTHLRNALVVAVGLWPLTAVVLLTFTLLLFAGRWASP